MPKYVSRTDRTYLQMLEAEQARTVPQKEQDSPKSFKEMLPGAVGYIAQDGSTVMYGTAQARPEPEKPRPVTLGMKRAQLKFLRQWYPGSF